MKRLGGFVFGAITLLSVSAAYAQAPGPAVSGTMQAPLTQPQAPGTLNRSSPALFWIGNLPVRMWAPVQPSYDQNGNRVGAEKYIWPLP